MRDTFLLLWVGFLVVGVIGSIVSSARKQVQRASQDGSRPVILSERAAPPPPPAKAAPPRVTPSAVVDRRTPVQPKAPAAPAPAPDPLHDLMTPHHHAHRFFRSRQAIVQAVITAEVLGKPRALRDEYL